jgi:uncharacterized membrane protein YhaH (DUF805 family)
MKKYALLRGRTTRAEYWQFTLVVFVIFFIAAFIDQYVRGSYSGMGTPAPKSLFTFINILLLIHFVPGFAINVRRAHDANLSAIWAVIGLFIPIASIIIGCLPSYAADNKYGHATVAAEARVDGYRLSS